MQIEDSAYFYYAMPRYHAQAIGQGTCLSSRTLGRLSSIISRDPIYSDQILGSYSCIAHNDLLHTCFPFPTTVV
jgi:hypothetical protein